MYSPPSRRDFLRAAALAVVAALVWIVWQNAWTRTAWDSPAAYSVDALEYLARLKLAEERGAAFLVDETVPRLGAPGVADWSAYPMPDRPINVATGWLARVTGLIVAGNVSLLAAHMLAVLAFFAGARLLGHRPLFAAAGGLVFGFSYFIAQRGFSHFSFALAFVVPLMLAFALIAGGARRRLERRAWRVGGAAVAAIVALGNPYFGFVFGQLLLFALLARMVLHRGRGARVVAAWLAVYLAVFVLANFAALRAMLSGEGAVMARNYAATEIYGLRPIEFFIPPPTHRWSAAAELGGRYAAATSLKGELFFPYLGLVGVAALGVLVAAGARRLVQGRLSLRPAYLPLSAWIVVFAMVGGAAAAFAFGVTDLFRATNRYSVCVLALALFALTSWATRRRSRLPRAVLTALTAGAVLLALWDQLPPRSPDRKELHARVVADRQFAAALEAALPRGAMVFQLPAVPFLEQPPVGAMTDYELFRPFLHSTTLRFSYGPLADAPLQRWQRNVARLPAADCVAALERAGFAALYVRRDAFADHAAALEHALAQMGRARLLDIDHQLVFRLQPVGAPVPPTANDPLNYDRWDDSPPAPGVSTVLVGRGWFGVEHDPRGPWRWAGQHATLLLWNASAQPRTARLRFTVTTTSATEFSAQSGPELRRAIVPAYRAQPFEMTMPLRPGLNELHCSTAAGARRAGPADSRLIAFNLAALEVEFLPASPE